ADPAARAANHRRRQRTARHGVEDDLAARSRQRELEAVAAAFEADAVAGDLQIGRGLEQPRLVDFRAGRVALHRAVAFELEPDAGDAASRNGGGRADEKREVEA